MISVARSAPVVLTRVCRVPSQHRSQSLHRHAHGASVLGMFTVPLRVSMAAITNRGQICRHVEQPCNDRARVAVERGPWIDAPDQIDEQKGPASASQECQRLRRGGGSRVREPDGNNADHSEQGAEQTVERKGSTSQYGDEDKSRADGESSFHPR